MQALRHSRSLPCAPALGITAAATHLLGRGLPTACTAAADGLSVTAAGPSGANGQPSCCARGYASPLHGMAYNERPHEWLLNDPDDKDAVEHVRCILLLEVVARSSVVIICASICMLLLHS